LDATQAEINEAARKAEAWQVICTLPDGMRTRVGDRGMQLSGGQYVILFISLCSTKLFIENSEWRLHAPLYGIHRW
jgi:ABC-type bacteriocin/lantibiotic exporter with double-glycine peptidase domain